VDLVLSQISEGANTPNKNTIKRILKNTDNIPEEFVDDVYRQALDAWGKSKNDGSVTPAENAEIDAQFNSSKIKSSTSPSKAASIFKGLNVRAQERLVQQANAALANPGTSKKDKDLMTKILEAANA